MWKEGALDVVRDALEFLNHFGEEDPASLFRLFIIL